MINADSKDPQARAERPADREAREYRATTGQARSCYAIEIGDSPTLRPGDTKGAAAYLARIQAAIDKGGWSSSERTRLYRLQAKWRSRAMGDDARFNIAGTKPGRLDEGLERQIREARAVKRIKEAATKVQRDKRRKQHDWSGIDGDSAAGDPAGFAKGAPEELEGDAGDDETGELASRRKWTDRDFVIPGQDSKGHSHRVYCRVMPSHYRALAILKDEKRFPFSTIGDIMRWCIDKGIRELNTLKKHDGVDSLLAQVQIIQEVLAAQTAQQQFAAVFDNMAHVVKECLVLQASGEARRIVAMVKAQIEQMPEGYWRDRYASQLAQDFGHLLDGSTQTGVKLS